MMYRRHRGRRGYRTRSGSCSAAKLVNCVLIVLAVLGVVGLQFFANWMGEGMRKWSDGHILFERSAQGREKRAATVEGGVARQGVAARYQGRRNLRIFKQDAPELPPSQPSETCHHRK